MNRFMHAIREGATRSARSRVIWVCCELFFCSDKPWSPLSHGGVVQFPIPASSCSGLKYVGVSTMLRRKGNEFESNCLHTYLVHARWHNWELQVRPSVKRTPGRAKAFFFVPGHGSSAGRVLGGAGHTRATGMSSR